MVNEHRRRDDYVASKPGGRLTGRFDARVGTVERGARSGAA